MLLISLPKINHRVEKWKTKLRFLFSKEIKCQNSPAIRRLIIKIHYICTSNRLFNDFFTLSPVSKYNLAARMASMFESNEAFKDVEIHASGTKFTAHKIVLAA
jgi:hypothetical protein